MKHNYSTGISVNISADSIFLDSLATISMVSPSPFDVEINNTIIDITKGFLSATLNAIQSVESDGRHVVEVVVTEMFKEKLVSDNYTKNLKNAYGMSFYPFVSSLLDSKIIVSNQPINIVLLDLPDSYRILWSKANVVDGNSYKAFLRHAFGLERSKYIFRWSERGKESNSIQLAIPLRLGGKALLRITNFPFMYWLLSLFIIAIASTSDKTSILLASVGAAWIFMLRQWNLSNVPQENTLLTHAYLVHGLFIPIWAASWHYYSNWALAWLPIVIAFIYAIQVSTHRFKRDGMLPRSIAEYWLKAVIDK